MAALGISVIIVSRHRPDWLERCLRAVGQLDYPCFETLVVACPAGAKIARSFESLRVIDLDVANISTARNVGVNAAQGEVVAFIDDDAVPEPTWLSHLAAGFTDPDVVQVGGTTLGRNGLSVQHAAALVDATGQSFPVSVSMEDPAVLTPADGKHPRLHGTNMALRWSAITEHAGFDERFAFYLDETDLSYRVSCGGGRTVFAPKAVVHHASGPSTYRDADRTPRHVFEIAASAAVFHDKHCEPSQRQAAQTAFLTDRRKWILRHMQQGPMTPDTAWALMRELDAGYAAGCSRAAIAPPSWASQVTGNVDHRGVTADDIYFVTSGRDTKTICAKAKALAAKGQRVTVFDFRQNARYHRVSYTNDGFWLHTGGIYGREIRNEAVIRSSTLEDRVRQTLERLKGIRSKNPLFPAG